MCAKGTIEPELAGQLGNFETEVDYLFFASFRPFVTFCPFLLRSPCAVSKCCEQYVRKAMGSTFERLGTACHYRPSL